MTDVCMHVCIAIPVRTTRRSIFVPVGLGTLPAQARPFAFGYLEYPSDYRMVMLYEICTRVRVVRCRFNTRLSVALAVVKCVKANKLKHTHMQTFRATGKGTYRVGLAGRPEIGVRLWEQIESEYATERLLAFFCRLHATYDEGR